MRASASSISLVFLTGNEILKMYLKIMEKIRMKHKKISLLAKSKPNSIEEIISKALENAKTRHEEITLFRNEEENYHRFKDSIRIKDSQEGDIQRNRLLEHSKHISGNEIFKQNER